MRRMTVAVSPGGAAECGGVQRVGELGVDDVRAADDVRRERGDGGAGVPLLPGHIATRRQR